MQLHGNDKETEARTNKLIGESSPYLLLHAHNPVDWYPWGEECLQKAKSENRPIFLSIGYSACHWSQSQLKQYPFFSGMNSTTKAEMDYAVICRNFTCSLPIYSLTDFQEHIKSI
jgi:uncharacterized protein YyaL (SSP411 family)